MKIHFTAALRGNKEVYQKFFNILKKLGYEIITDHILKRDIEEVEKETPEEAELYSRKMQRWIRNADIVISEVSVSDVSVGYEITIALNLGKPVILLYTRGNEPHALKGTNLEKLHTFSYNLDNLEEVLKEALVYAKDQMDVRFNFFISPKIGAYLDWMSRTKKVPRAVYLRKLIEEDMAGSGYTEKGNNNKNKNKKKTE